MGRAGRKLFMLSAAPIKCNTQGFESKTLIPDPEPWSTSPRNVAVSVSLAGVASAFPAIAQDAEPCKCRKGKP